MHQQYLSGHVLELTLASLQALKPRVLKARVASTSTIVEPSATATATTHLTKIVGNAALGTNWDCGR